MKTEMNDFAPLSTYHKTKVYALINSIVPISRITLRTGKFFLKTKGR